MQQVVIIGASGHGREVLDTLAACNAAEPRFDFLGFLDDNRDADERVIGPVSDLERLGAGYLVGIASPMIRRRMDVMATSWGRPPVSIVHPDATLGLDVTLAEGVVIAAGVRVTTNVTIGRQVHINVNATVSHDCVLHDFVTVTPGVSIGGGVTVGEGAYLGVGSSIIQNLTIGERTIVGAGAIVIRDLPADVTAVGVPARPFER